MKRTGQTHHGSLASYIAGFILSIAFTLGAYYVVKQHVESGHLEFSHGAILWIISTLAVLQLFVQLYFFLHLGKESKPRWNLMAFLFAVLIVAILVVGSIWIMHNLDYNMTGDEIDTYIQEEERIYPNRE